MYAVIETGGKQYRVTKDDLLTVGSLKGETGSVVEFSNVLMLKKDSKVVVGAPTVSGAKVTAQLVSHGRAPKVIVFKKRRRKKSRRKNGHRQGFSIIRITDITTGALE